MKSIPKRIYLQVGEDINNTDNFKDLEEVTWCSDKLNSTDLVYYSASVVKKLRAELREAKENLSWRTRNTVPA